MLSVFLSASNPLSHRHPKYLETAASQPSATVSALWSVLLCHAARLCLVVILQLPRLSACSFVE